MVIERLPQVENLSTQEKWVLVDELWSALLSDNQTSDADSLVVAELERRMTEYEAAPASGVTWEMLRQRLPGKG